MQPFAATSAATYPAACDTNLKGGRPQRYSKESNSSRTNKSLRSVLERRHPFPTFVSRTSILFLARVVLSSSRLAGVRLSSSSSSLTKQATPSSFVSSRNSCKKANRPRGAPNCSKFNYISCESQPTQTSQKQKIHPLRYFQLPSTQNERISGPGTALLARTRGTFCRVKLSCAIPEPQTRGFIYLDREGCLDVPATSEDYYSPQASSGRRQDV